MERLENESNGRAQRFFNGTANCPGAVVCRVGDVVKNLRVELVFGSVLVMSSMFCEVSYRKGVEERRRGCREGWLEEGCAKPFASIQAGNNAAAVSFEVDHS